MPDSKIIERIRKLLELADESRGGTKAERELAAQRAQELMLKHNLDSAELSGQSAPGDVGEDGQRVEGSQAEWQVQLIAAVGEECFVTVYWIKRGRFAWDVVTVGRADNIAFVDTLCKHLIPWLKQEAKEAFKVAQRLEGDAIKPRSFRRAFYASAIREIALRLRMLRRHTTGSTGEELVRNEDAANKLYLEVQGVNVRPSRYRNYGSDAGHAAGENAGRRADLTPGRKLR